MQQDYLKKSQKIHETVLTHEVAEYLLPTPGKKVVDATLGTGGHTLELVRAGASVLGIDADMAMVDLAEERFKKEIPEGTFKLVQGNFRQLDEIAAKADFGQVSGVLFDLGVSNIHLTQDSRGFSFSDKDAPLDMRLNPETQSVTAADLVNALRPDQLRELFESTMDSGASVWLSRRIVSQRESAKLRTVGDLLVATHGLREKPGLNPATKPMLALRMAVNSEIDNLIEALPKAFDLLEEAGRLAVIAFHSGEDKLVKDFFKKMEAKGLAKIVTKDAVYATEEELRVNPRARSARMRVLEKYHDKKLQK